MKLTNCLKVLLTVAFVACVFSSAYTGQKGVVLSPVTEGVKLVPDASKVTPEKVNPGKVEPKAVMNDIKVTSGEPKSEPKVVPKKVKPGAVKTVPQSSKSGKETQKVTSVNQTEMLPSKPKSGGSEIVPKRKAGEVGTGGFVPLKVEKKKEIVTTVKCNGLTPTIFGTPGDDRLWVSGSQAHVIHGLGGNDIITGGSGDDVICGGDGNDAIDGGSGNDRLYGGDGDDALDGGKGNDELYGGDDSINLFVGGENDGNDRLDGGAGNDGLYGGSGDDRLYGGGGDDNLNGGSGKDRLGGNDGNDVIEGGSGDDQLYGGSGDDELYGYVKPKSGVNLLGNEDDLSDKLHGGSGNDLCIVGTGNIVPSKDCEERGVVPKNEVIGINIL